MKKEKLKVLIAVLLIILFAFSVIPKYLQNDTFYIIKLGNYIKENGIDFQDHYSMHSNLEYRYPHWAFDVIVSCIYNLYGFLGTYLFTGILASIFVLIVFWNLLRKEVNFNLAFISTLIVTYLMKDTFFTRGQTLSYTIFLLEFMILENFVERPTFFKSLALFALSAIMANCHATAWIMMLVLVLPFIGEQILYEFSIEGISKRQIKKYKAKYELAKKLGASKEELAKLEEKWKSQEEFDRKYSEEEALRERKIITKKKPNIKYIWVAILVIILGALITPIKDTPYIYVLKTMAGNTMNYINEHLPIVPANSLEFLTYSILFVAIIGFTKSKFKLYEALTILGLYMMALSGRRGVYLLIGITAGIIIKAIDDFIKSNIKDIKLKTTRNVFVVTCVAVMGLGCYMFYDNNKSEYVLEQLYPVKAVEYIKENLDYKNMRMYNRYEYGSYLLMNDIPVFIDSRCDLYTPEFNKGIRVFDDFMDAQYGDISISALMDKYELNYILVPVKSYENTYISEDSNYMKIYSDENFVMYLYQ